MSDTKKCTVRFNKAQCGIELLVPDGVRLSDKELEFLKKLGFAWHRKNHYWYTKYTDEKMATLRKALAKSATFPAQKDEPAMQKLAEEAAAKAPKKPAKKMSSSERMDRLESTMSQLLELLAANAAASTKTAE